MRAIFQLAMKTSTCCCTPPILFNKNTFPGSLQALSLYVCINIYIYTYIYIYIYTAYSCWFHHCWFKLYTYIYIYIDMWIPLQRPTSPFGLVPVTRSGSHLMGCHILHVYYWIYVLIYLHIYIIYCMSHVYIPASSKVGWISAFCPINKFCRRTTFLGKPEFLLIYIAKPVFQRRKCLTKRRKYPTKPRKYPITWADNFSQRH